MSSMAQPDQTSQQQQQQGTETFLSPEERKQLQRLMGHPTDYPKEMMSHIRSWLEVNPPDLPISTFKGKGVPRFLYRSSDPLVSDVVSTATETTVFSYTIKEKSISPSGRLNVFYYNTVKCSDVSNDVYIRIKLGGTEITSENFVLNTDILDGNYRPSFIDGTIRNVGAYNNQIETWMIGYNSESGAFNNATPIDTSSVDMSQDQELVVTVQWTSGNANSSVRPHYFAVEVFNPVGG